MKISTFTFLSFVVLGSTANAQKLTILPQVGLENLVTKVDYNNLSAFKPLEALPTPTLGVRMDYKVKKVFGVFAGLSTSRPTVAYSFTNPETGMNAYTAAVGDLQLQLQGGLQATTKPIYFSKSAAAAKPAPGKSTQSSYGRCGAYKSMGNCGGRNKAQASKPAQNQSWFVRIMPSAGLALNPFTPANVMTKAQGTQNTYTYNAGNSKTALITGVGFEFGSKAQRLFTVNINYLKGLGNNTESITSVAGAKPATTVLNSTVSGWNASIGVPLSLGKKPVVRQVEHKKYEYRHNQYRGGCTRRVI